VSYWDDKTVARYTIDHTAKKLVLRQVVADTGGNPSIYNGSVVFNPDGKSFYVVNVYDRTGYRAGNVQRYTIDHATGKVMPQEYMPAGFQPVALAIAK
jgi:DNA-binding beta-propeller fold protein YncE